MNDGILKCWEDNLRIAINNLKYSKSHRKSKIFNKIFENNFTK